MMNTHLDNGGKTRIRTISVTGGPITFFCLPRTLLRHSGYKICIEHSSCTKLFLRVFVLLIFGIFDIPHGICPSIHHAARVQAPAAILDLSVQNEGLGYHEVYKLALDRYV